MVLYGNEDYLVQQTIANGDTKGECMDMGWNISLFQFVVMFDISQLSEFYHSSLTPQMFT